MNINVNGRDIAVSPEAPLLVGLLENGFDVPNLCHMKALEPYGGCGLCLVEISGTPKLQRACAILPAEGMEVLTDTERIHKTRQMNLGMLLSDHRGDCRPPCHLACPAGQDCQAYIGMIADGQFAEAFRRIMEDNPLPGCIGRVCPHPCEDACRRKLLEAPVSLMHLKRFAADTAGASFMPGVQPATGKSVAIVGAGPAGLSAAYYLTRAGHQVHVYDMMDRPGGMLRYGIPSYRLPKDIVDLEAGRIEKMGAVFHFTQKLGRDISLSALQASHDAVFVAVGAWASTRLGCDGDTVPGVLGGIDFLAQVAQGNAPDVGDRVAVVGGGNTAMDAVRTAVRLGAKEVHLLYRRTRAEMPADDLEIEEAEEEGVLFNFLVTPQSVLMANGRAAGLRLSQMRLGDADASGRRRPEPTGETLDIPFDTIIAAIGQRVVPDGLSGVALTRWGTIACDENTFETSLPGVFAGGDAVNDGPGIAIAAIGHGKRAAAAIDGYLRGEAVSAAKPFYVEQHDITAEDIPPTPAVHRVQVRTEPPESRIQHFEAFTEKMTPEEAVREAGRCLECGCCDLYDCRLLPLMQAYQADAPGVWGRARKHRPDRSHPTIWRDANKCILCGLCVRTCASLVGATALGFDGRGFDTLAAPAFGWPMPESDCISCGLCAQVCPTGALQDRKPFQKSPPLPAQTEAIACTYCGRGCRFTLETYGSRVLRALPVAHAESCSIGRYAPLVTAARGKAFTPEQEAALRKVLTGDLRAFAGDLPASIGPISLMPEG